MADTYESLRGQADKKLSEIRKLGSKSERRWFGVGPRKKMTQNDRIRMQSLRRNESDLRSRAMQRKRIDSGRTKMVGRKEVRSR